MPDQERLSEQAREQYETCGVCGRGYPVWFAPSELWNRVARREDGELGDGMVCPLCFMLDAESKGIGPTAWVLHEEPDPPRVLRRSVDCWGGLE